MELGGLEDEDGELPPVEFDEEEEIFFNREEVMCLFIYFYMMPFILKGL